MPVLNLDKIFAPSSIAVVGASARPASVGNTVLRNLFNSGFNGRVYPVNLKHKEIEGRPCFGSIEDLPEVVDLAIICTPASTVPEVLRECRQLGIRRIVILSAGFREASDAGQVLELEVRSVAQQFEGMRIIGPNCLGILVPHLSLNASFASDMPAPGQVAFISQSGALCTAILDWAISEKIGFSSFVSIGNMVDVGIADLIDYFATDNRTKSIILYIESINEAREFMSAARAFTRTKPIIAYKAGRFAESAKAAASHTGAMAGVDSVYDAALARAGIVRIFEVDDLFDCAELLARKKIPIGPQLAIVTNAGGPGVMATDALLERKGVLAKLSDGTMHSLNMQLPSAWSRGNPVDVLGDAPPERLASAVQLVLADDAVDGVLVILTPQAMTDPTGAARALIESVKGLHKPLLAVWMGGAKVRDGIGLLNEAQIPTYSTPEKAVRAFMYLVEYNRNHQVLYETPRDIPLNFDLDREQLRKAFNQIASSGGNLLSEVQSKTLLQAYEISVTPTYLARSIDEALKFADQVGYPVVLKVFSPDITHKTDIGGVELNLSTQDQVAKAFDRIVGLAKQSRPDADVQGVSVQHMLTEPNKHELIIGAKRDPVFGTVLLVGAGGTKAELFHDQALELPPLTERLARRMLESLQLWPLLQGHRGRRGVNVDRLVEVLMRLSYLVADCCEIIELDINPLLVTPEYVIAVDARMVVDRDRVPQPSRRYSHLAIRPYPIEFIKTIELNNGVPVLLRPIKPEDEPMWHELVKSCSQESLHKRFRYTFKTTAHELATRFCFIDYDREMAIVAEIEECGRRKLVGVGRLKADPDHHQAEYAVLVSDPWQQLGLGSKLTDHCLSICQRWGLRSIIAESAPYNDHMIRIFEHCGFEIDRSDSQNVVVARKLLTQRNEFA